MPVVVHIIVKLREYYQEDHRIVCCKYWNDGIKYYPDLTAHLVVLRQCGICLAGKPLAETFPLVPEHDFRAASVNNLQAAREHPLQDLSSFVLNACRVLAYLHESTILSKDAGGIWGLAHLPAQYHPLIYQALALYQGERPRRPVGYAALDDFIAYIHEAVLPSQVLKVTTPHCSCKRKRVCVDDKRLRDEEAAYEDEAMARWLDDGGTSDHEAAYARHAFLPVMRML